MISVYTSVYADSLEFGINPEEDSQYWVAPFIQAILDDLIEQKRSDIALELKDKTSMKLN